jgi:hypothetical protein
MQRVQVGVLQVHSSVVLDKVRLEFQVSSGGGVVFYGTTSSMDISDACRRLIHMVFGDPTQTSQEFVSGLLRGIPMLLQGKKLRYVSERPSWVVPSQVMEVSSLPDVDLVLEVGSSFLQKIFHYILPVVFVLWAIPDLYRAVVSIGDPEQLYFEIALLKVLGGVGGCYFVSKFFLGKSDDYRRSKLVKF